MNFRVVPSLPVGDTRTVTWYADALTQDAITGAYYPRSEMALVNGRWIHRDNVDEEETRNFLKGRDS